MAATQARVTCASRDDGPEPPPTSCAGELRALRVDVQRTLARLRRGLGSDFPASFPPPPPVPSTTLPVRSWTQTPRGVAAMSHTPTTVSSSVDLDASAMLQELVVTARRRREAETELLRVLEQEEEAATAAASATTANARASTADCIWSREPTPEAPPERIMAEIASLRQRRRLILEEIDTDAHSRSGNASDSSAVEAPTDGEEPTSSSVSPAHELRASARIDVATPPQELGENAQPREYAIEGIVTIAPTASTTTDASTGAGAKTKTLSASASVRVIRPRAEGCAHCDDSERGRRVDSTTATDLTGCPSTTPPPPMWSQSQPSFSSFAGAAVPPRTNAYAFLGPGDALQDVFSIQLKFAETMLQLEKSIQMRDRILAPVAPPRVLSTSASQVSRRRAPSVRRRRVTIGSRIATTSTTIGSSSERLEQAHPDSSFSMAGASTSDDTMQIIRRYRRRDAPGATFVRADPKSRGDKRGPIAEGGGSASTPSTTGSAGASSTPESLPTPETQDGKDNDDDDNDTGDQVAFELRTPPPRQLSESQVHNTHARDARMTKKHVLSNNHEDHTPSTGESSGKQVRFHAAPTEYSTPLIARNISFEHESMDSSEDLDDGGGRGARTTLSMTRVLLNRTRSNVALRVHDPSSSEDDVSSSFSFPDDTSFTSSDLNSASFVAAFEALRREVRGLDGLRKGTAGRLLLPSVAEVVKAPESDPHPPTTTTTTSLARQRSPKELEVLTQRRRSVTLDVQELTARLVLTTDPAERHVLMAELDRLREELDVINGELAQSTTFSMSTAALTAA